MTCDNEGGVVSILYKYDKFGNNLWRKQLGTYIDGNNVLDNIQQTYSLAELNNKVWIVGKATTGCGGRFGTFVQQLYDNGTLVWNDILRAETNSSELYAIDVDDDANAYVVGMTDGRFDGKSLIGGNSPGDIVVMKYNSSGTRQWTKLMGTTANDTANAITVKDNNSIYISGYTRGNLVHSTSTYNAFVMKLDSSGTTQWTYQFESSVHTDVEYNSIITDNASNIYLVGWVGHNQFLSGNSSAGYDDYFFVKLNDSGQLLFANQFGTSSYDQAKAVAKDSSNNFYITGSTGGAFSGYSNAGCSDIFLSKFYDNGTKQWTKQYGESGCETPYDINVDDTDHIYIVGSSSGNLDGSTNNGKEDIFLMKFDMDGNKK